MKSLRVLLTSFLLLIVCQRSQAADPLSDVLARCEKSVIKIKTSSVEGSGIGSGFVVSADGMIVTNYHVLTEAESATVTFSDGRISRVRGVYVSDPTKDIAIAQIDGANYLPLELATAEPRKGESIYAIGAPMGFEFTVSRGIISGIRTADQMVEMGISVSGTWVQVDAPISKGNSGGPLINGDGKVVAMSTLAHTLAQNLNFGISARDIKEAIDLAKVTPMTESTQLPEIDKMPKIAELVPNEVSRDKVRQFLADNLTKTDKLVESLKVHIIDEREYFRRWMKVEPFSPANYAKMTCLLYALNKPTGRIMVLRKRAC